MTMGPVSYAGRKIPCDLDPNLDKLLLLIPVYSSLGSLDGSVCRREKEKEGKTNTKVLLSLTILHKDKANTAEKRTRWDLLFFFLGRWCARS